MKEIDWTKPSEVLRVAREDLMKISDKPQYVINMGTYHGKVDPTSSECHVCLAGAVMAGTLSVPLKTEAGPADFDDASVRNALRALDAFRAGCVDTFLEYFKYDFPETLRLKSREEYRCYTGLLDDRGVIGLAQQCLCWGIILRELGY